jgi:hypothetical protein
MKISVTQSHIERGEIHDKWKVGTPRGCPVAIALNEQIPTCEATVISKKIGVLLCSVLGSQSWNIELPDRAWLFVHAFDTVAKCGHRAPQLKPFTFNIDVPNGAVATEPAREKAGALHLSIQHNEKSLTPLLSK